MRDLLFLGLIFLGVLSGTRQVPADDSILPSGMHADLVYGHAAGEMLLLDAYVPEGEGPFPVAIIVHGGGWIRGDKQDEISLLFGPLSEAGFTWFSVNYRLAPAFRWPACLEDVEAAVLWVKKYAPRFRGDPERIALIGYSAGGQIAFLAGMRAKTEARVQAVAGLAPATDLEQDLEKRGGLSIYLQALFDRPRAVTDESLARLREASPINHVQPGLPPFILIHGDADQSVPVIQSVQFQERLRENGVPCDLILIQGAPHRIAEWERFEPGFRNLLTDRLLNALNNHISEE
ncbi:MAG TPA: alpha/beta hydrolase [bacterium]|nr:alpha/beta hydrolase [bacterium]